MWMMLRKNIIPFEDPKLLSHELNGPKLIGIGATFLYIHSRVHTVSMSVKFGYIPTHGKQVQLTVWIDHGCWTLFCSIKMRCTVYSILTGVYPVYIYVQGVG